MKYATLALLAACSATATSAPPDLPDPPPQRTFDCIPPSAGSRITHAVADGKRVRYCIGESEHCFVLDPDSTDARSFAKVPKPTAVEQGAYVETTQPRLDVCNSMDCTSLATLVLPKISDIRAATSSDGTVAAFLFGGTAPKGYVELWDVATTKKLATVKYGKGDFQCGDLAMLGQTLLVKMSVCGSATPSSQRGALYSIAGKKLADVGGKDFALAQVAHVDEANAWAFLDETGARLAIHDVARGTLTKLIDTSGVFLIGGGKQGVAGESALVRLGDGRLLLVAGSPAVGSVAAIDPKTGQVELRQAPICR